MKYFFNIKTTTKVISKYFVNKEACIREAKKYNVTKFKDTKGNEYNTI